MFVAQELLDVPQHERRYRIEVEHKAAIHRPAGIEFTNAAVRPANGSDGSAFCRTGVLLLALRKGEGTE